MEPLKKTIFPFGATAVILCLFLLATACNNKKRQLTKLVEEWQGKEILFPSNPELKLYGRDTVCPELFSREYKILNFIDTNGCTECRLKLFDWQMLKEEIDSLNLNVSLVFVAWVKNYKQLEDIQKLNRFNTPLLYDRTGQADSLNHFPIVPGFQTFLLDKNNRVLLIGSPLGNETLWNLYKKTIRSGKQAETKP